MDEILNLIESVSEDFPSYSFNYKELDIADKGTKRRIVRFFFFAVKSLLYLFAIALKAL